MHRRLTLAVATLVAIAAGGGVYVALYPDQLLAVGTAFVYFVAVRLATDHAAALERVDVATLGPLLVAAVAFVGLGTVVGIGPTLPLPMGLRLGLWVFAVGLAAGGLALGVALGRHAARVGARPRE